MYCMKLLQLSFMKQFVKTSVEMNIHCTLPNTNDIPSLQLMDSQHQVPSSN